MATINGQGVGVRHAVARTLGTANLAPAEATFRVLSARVTLDERRRVVRGEATVAIERPSPIGERTPTGLEGLVNPDGLHPLMSRVPGCELADGAAVAPFFIDILPVTWRRWHRLMDEDIPSGTDKHCPRTGVSFEEAQAMANAVGKSLPTLPQMRAAWGPDRFPWGERADPTLGRIGAPRWEELPELGLHPPARHGIWDLGTWLWQWTAEGLLVGGHSNGPRAEAPGLQVLRPTDDEAADLAPIGIRLAQEA